MNLTELIGIPFLNGGRDRNGADCWGVTRIVWNDFYHKKLPDYKISCENAIAIENNINTQKPNWIRVEIPVEPCLVVMHFNSRFCNHTGTYIGDGQFIHTAEKMGVKIDELSHPYWKRHIEGFYVPNF